MNGLLRDVERRVGTRDANAGGLEIPGAGKCTATQPVIYPNRYLYQSLSIPIGGNFAVSSQLEEQEK
jgi:hypothetical protein